MFMPLRSFGSLIDRRQASTKPDFWKIWATWRMSAPSARVRRACGMTSMARSASPFASTAAGSSATTNSGSSPTRANQPPASAR
jgi:hypothetical protein